MYNLTARIDLIPCEQKLWRTHCRARPKRPRRGRCRVLFFATRKHEGQIRNRLIVDRCRCIVLTGRRVVAVRGYRRQSRMSSVVFYYLLLFFFFFCGGIALWTRVSTETILKRKNIQNKPFDTTTLELNGFQIWRGFVINFLSRQLAKLVRFYF